MENSIITTTEEEINQRQHNIVGDFSEKIALVVGLGGIGSWVAIDLALIGVGTLILFDNDTIESSNLNRTLFKLSQAGELKTKAVKQLISERRKNILVITNDELFTSEHLNKYSGVDYLFDCTDTTKLKDAIAESLAPATAHTKSQPQPNTTKQTQSAMRYVKCGYDGFHGTICVNDFTTGRWGQDSSYTVTPSFFGTPQIISAYAVIELLMKNKLETRTVNMNVKQAISILNEA